MTIPLQVYHNDFLFIVNDEEFKKNKVVTDILRSVIIQIHLNDQMFDISLINKEILFHIFSIFLNSNQIISHFKTSICPRID